LTQAIKVNPHDIAGLKDAIMQAIDMPQKEKDRRMRALRRRVRENDVAKWSERFLSDLNAARKEHP
jgi:trehalose 6-phosphate synthase